jgi:nitroreductase
MGLIGWQAGDRSHRFMKGTDMQVSEALRERHSVRAFLPTPVERKKIEAIVAVAARTPSWANSQPWDVFVATGEPLERIRAGFADSRAAGKNASPELSYPTEWPAAAKARIGELQETQRSEYPEGFKDFVHLNQVFFNAPAVFYLCLDKLFSHWGLYDLGAYSQSIMLAAKELGLDSIPAIQLVVFPDVIHRELQIPENLHIAIGVAIGHADGSNDINRYVSRRDPLDKTVRILG